MSFGNPHALWLLAALPLLFVLFLQRERRSARLLTQLVAARLQPVLAGNASRGKRRLRFALLLLGLAGVLFALAQPRMGFHFEERKGSGRDILIAIDTSRSMLANDLSPTRLARVKLAAADLISKLRGDRVGLVAFAGTAFLQAPLTADYAEVLASLRELDTEIIPAGGTNLAEAIRAAIEAFGKGEGEHRALVIFTDGEELEADGLAAAKEAASVARIFTVGAGSPNGTIIAIPGERGVEYVKGPDGQIVKSRLDENRLRAIAEAAGGFYTLLQNGPPEMQHLVQVGLDAMNREDIAAQQQRRPIERYQWPLGAGLLLLVASLLPGERRRSARLGAAAAALALFLPLPEASAKNQGLEAYERQEFQEAQRSFERQLKRRPKSEELQFDLGAAAYKAGDLDRALEAFSKAVTATDPELRNKSEYNLGNTLVQRGATQKQKPEKLQDWRNALQHYEQVLKAAPADENAKYNHEVVQKMIRQLEQQPPEQQQDDEKKDQEKKDQDKKDQEKSDQQKEGQQSEPKSGQKKEEQEKSGEQQQSDKNEPGEKKDGQQSGAGDEKKKGDSGSGDKGEQQQASKDGEQPKPEEGEGKEERKLKGEIADADPAAREEQAKEQAQREAEQANEEAAAAEGKMTPAQAQALFDSIKSQDKRVRLWNDRGQAKPRTNLKNW